jgi:hypothetical protein
MRIELLAVSARSMPRLDVLDPAQRNTEPGDVGKYRRHYFLRRSIGTLDEFAEGLRLLQERPDFSAVMATAPADLAAIWDSSIAFFESNESLIKKVRNDIGRHFGNSAATYAISKLDPKAMGKVELSYDDTGRCDPRLHFAGEIAASAFLRHLPGGSVQEKLDGFIRDVLVEGYKHAAQAVQVLLVLYLWPRF